MTPEVWKPVADYPDYEVSNLGRVRSLDRMLKQPSRLKNVFSRQLKGRILRPGATRGGYRIVSLGSGSGSKRVCRLVAKAFCAGSGPVVRHKNGCVTDDRAKNLEWGTQGDNNRDAMRHGTFMSAKRLAHLRRIASLGGMACRR